MPTADNLRRAEWAVYPFPEHAEAVAFLTATHYARGASNTSTYRHGLYERRWEPFVGPQRGVALWQPPTRTVGEMLAGCCWGGVLALSRLAVEDDIPRNAASFLLAGSMRLLDRHRWPVLVTYADTGQGHTGGLYRACGWVLDGETVAGDTWTAPDGSQRGRKRGSRTLLARELEAAGYVRRPAAPKLRFIHRLP
jgi:hypothetical protein